MIATHTARHYVGGRPFALPGGRPAAARLGRIVRAATAPRAVLFVARRVDAVAGQVRGIVLTALITGGALILLLAVAGRWLIGVGSHHSAGWPSARRRPQGT